MTTKDIIVEITKLIKKEKRREYDRQRRIDSLKVPEDDPRRTMLQTIFKYYGARNFKKLEEFLRENCDDQFLYKFESKFPGYY